MYHLIVLEHRLLTRCTLHHTPPIDDDEDDERVQELGDEDEEDDEEEEGVNAAFISVSNF